MYAETDFYLALLKEGDWLKERAEALYKEHKSGIWTSQVTTQELLLQAYKHKRNPVDVVDAFYSIAKIEEVEFNRDFFLASTHIMERYSATPFDAMHAVIAKNEGVIISSDSIYDRMGLHRIKLEEK